MTCLLTGGYGFLGSYIYKTLLAGGHRIINISRRPGTQPEQLNICCDLSRSVPDLGKIRIEKVIHVAGKAHSIPRTPEEAEAFYAVNETGVRHLLTALEKQEHCPHTFVNISTVAVYGNDIGDLIDEQCPLNAYTPYGISKIRGEELIAGWCAEKGISFYNLRLPLVAGSHPPGNLGRMIQAIRKGYYLKLKDNNALKSVVLADDVAKLVVRLKDQPSGAYNLTDGYNPSIAEIEHALEEILKRKIYFQLSKKSVENLIWVGNLVKIVGIHNPVESIYKKLTASLTFSDEKARKELGWESENVLNYLPNLMF